MKRKYRLVVLHVFAAVAMLAGVLVAAQPAAAQPARTLREGPASAVGMDHAALERGVDLFRRAVERDELRGVVLLVARHGTIVLHEAIGWRHRGYRLPMEKDTLFRMASNTKPVVATAVLMLEEDGKLALSDPVAKHLPSFDNFRSRGITIFHLLTHTSGFRIGPIFYPFDEELKRGEKPTLEGAVAKFGKEGPEVEPGTSYSYSNAGYNTLGAVIERASGQPLEAFLKARIYDPLGMHDTLNHEDPTKLHRMATVYRGRRTGDGTRIEWTRGFTPDDPPDFPVIRASGGMISTALDYAKFLQMFLNKGAYGNVRLLSEAAVAKATTPHVKIDERASYGLGWQIDAAGVYSHSGSDGTYAWVDPARDLLGLVFTQSPGGINPREEFRKIVTLACRD
jgi:CubicO group peptidase (beta-lactamase class C family)